MLESRRVFQNKYLFRLIFAFWFLICWVEMVRAYAFSSGQGILYKWDGIINWPVSFFLSLWILSFLILDLYLHTRNSTRRQFLLVHFLASLICGVTNKILSGIIGILLERLFLTYETYTWEGLISHWKETYPDFIYGTLLYWLFLIMLLALDYYHRFRNQYTWGLELESRLMKSHLQTLRMQLKPHFLFNALNTIAMMVRKNNNKEAVNMVSGLSDMLRSSLARENKQFVSFEEELDLLKKYLSIESVRFQDRLDVQFDIDEKTLPCKVPNLLLQPIVENAFKHGLAKTIGPALIKISSIKKNNHTEMSVFNTGSSLPPDWDLNSSKGIGVLNTTHRLRRLYHGTFKFQVFEQDNGVLFKITLPFQRI
ncbi:histidine kinase [Fulvivirgaceae bacterium BMA10]|uniref:Histidine kinase n=1 Tax=Splendidivirga corallicola TaxID=3051826 RepID=A0ABT8KTR3_9BACT|nr:histidine kinase [Fulvivirgaceae bacterium BMA10]